jgi:hypothetical protein
MLPKASFPNSSPSSVRAVLILTIDFDRVKSGLRNSPGRPTHFTPPETKRPSACVVLRRSLSQLAGELVAPRTRRPLEAAEGAPAAHQRSAALRYRGGRQLENEMKKR